MEHENGRTGKNRTGRLVLGLSCMAWVFDMVQPVKKTGHRPQNASVQSPILLSGAK